MEYRVDLHTHTTASDGSLSPTELVKKAKEQGLCAVAITDHDTVEGLEEGIQAGEEMNVELVPGLEISTDFQGELHILGYYMDFRSEKLQTALGELQQYRRNRNPKIIQCLKKLDMDVSMGEVEALAGSGNIGRPHIAALLMNKGYVSSTNEAFERYLGEGKAAYVAKKKLAPREGIRLIRETGGIPVLAHPKYIALSEWDLKVLIKSLKGYGLMGIEAYYSTHSKPETELFVRIANGLDLLVTGGSDFHGFSKPLISLGTGLGDLRVGYQIMEALKQAKNQEGHH